MTTTSRTIWRRVRGRVALDSTSPRAEAAPAALSPGRRPRPARRRATSTQPAERRPAGDAGRVDPRQRADAPQDQAQRRRPGLGRRARGPRRSRGGRGPGGARRHDVGLLARLQRDAVPNVALPARLPRASSERADAGGFARMQYIEQPTARDLKANRDNMMHEAAKIKPVVIDESLIGPGEPAAGPRDGLHRRGAEGVQGTDAVAADGRRGAEVQLFLCVQDLTCPGRVADPLGGAGGARADRGGHRGQLAAVLPRPTRGWETRYPGLFAITDGTVDTSALTGPGLSLPDGPLA